MGLATKNTEVFLADATLYLELFGILTIAWQWLKMGIVAQKTLDDGTNEANFYEGKLFTLRYFFEYELVKIDSLAKRLTSADALTVEMREECF
jgi:butyryl-CoA dehydrogenase